MARNFFIYSRFHFTWLYSSSRLLPSGPCSVDFREGTLSSTHSVYSSLFLFAKYFHNCGFWSCCTLSHQLFTLKDSIHHWRAYFVSANRILWSQLNKRRTLNNLNGLLHISGKYRQLNRFKLREKLLNSNG